MALSRRAVAVPAVVAALLALLPLVLGSSHLSLPTEVFLFAIFAMTYDVLFGFTGLISFGQALFVGAGAYSLAYTMTQHGLSVIPALVVAVLTGFVLSTLTGLLALRTRGVYFAMVTLAFAQAAFTLAESDVGGLTGGDNGMLVSGIPTWLSGPGSGVHFYWVALIAMAAAYLLLRLFVESPAGRVWQAIRENEQRALMLGYRPFVFKLLSYVVAGTVASLAGALYALFVGGVSTNLLSADTTIELLLMVIIGGAGSLWGAIAGAAVERYLRHYLTDLSTSSFVTGLPHPLQATLGQPLLIFGCVYLVIVYFFPEGIAGLARRRRSFSSTGPLPGLSEVESRAGAPVTSGEEAEPTPAATESMQEG